MTTSEFDTLNKMIDAYAQSGKFTSVNELLSEIKDGMVLDFLDILPKYKDTETILSKLKYIRDNVVQQDCASCIEREEHETAKEKKTMSEYGN